MQISSSGTSAGAYTYTPAAGFLGMDRFYFVASDGVMYSNVASVSIDVEAGMPQLGTAFLPDGTVDEPETSTWYSAEFAQHIDPAQLQILSQLANGTVVANSDGSITFTASGPRLGSFQYGYGPDVPTLLGTTNVLGHLPNQHVVYVFLYDRCHVSGRPHG